MGENIVKLKDVIDRGTSNLSANKLDDNNGDYPVYGATGLLKNIDFFQQDKEYLAIIKDGAGVGRVYHYPAKSSVLGTMQYLFPKENINIRFAYYFLKSLDFKKYTCGAAIPHIYYKDYCNETLSLPSIEEQIRIVSILDKADEIRTKKRLANDKLDEFLKSTFIDMFGDPVKNDKSLPITRVGELTTLVSSGSTPLGGSSVYQDEGVLFIRSQNVLMNKFDFTDIAHISDEIYNSMTRTQVQMNDVLLNITGASIGRIHRYMFKDKANVNQHVCIIRPVLDKVSPVYLEYCIGNSNYQHNILRQNSGATRQAFNFEQIKGFKIPLPPIEDQNKFTKIVEHVEAQKQKNEIVIEQMNNLFNSLSQRAFKGEL